MQLLLFAVSALAAVLAIYQAFPRPSPYQEITQILSTYPLAIDSKNYTLLSSVFAPEATANYTGPASNLTGLSGIEAGLKLAVSPYYQTQHLLGSPTIIVESGMGMGLGMGMIMGGKASSVQYFQATLFEASKDVTTLFGVYYDEFVKGKEGWRIQRRELVFQGMTFQKDASITF